MSSRPFGSLVVLAFAFAVMALGSALGAGVAQAQNLSTYDSARALGMASAVRASATGDVGLMLNPSGMALIRSYALEAAYQNRSPGSENVAHVSVVDSTSGFNVAGGVYYTYLNAKQKVGGVSVDVMKGHEGGLALALPFGDHVAIGATGKYVSLDMPVAELTGFTMDVGLTVRPLPSVSLGVAGYNLMDIDSPRHIRSLGWGLGVGAAQGLLLEVDGLIDLRDDSDAAAELSLMGGAEYVFASILAVRAGGGRDGVSRNGHVNVGASLISAVGALDVGFRRDVSGDGRATIFAVSGRLFVPSP